jgi:hypothetical protein
VDEKKTKGIPSEKQQPRRDVLGWGSFEKIFKPSEMQSARINLDALYIIHGSCAS